MPNATVRLRNLQTNKVEQTTTANERGEFSFAALPDVPYVVEIADYTGRIVAVGDVITAQAGEVAGAVVANGHSEPEVVESPLTKREREILQLVADGHSTAEIARSLFISAKTVKNHLASIYAKLDSRDRTQAVLSGMRLGIVQLQ